MEHWLTEKSWETGDIKCLMGLCCLWPNLHKVHENFPGCILPNLLVNDQSPTQRGFPAVMSNRYTCLQNTRMFKHWPILILGSCFTFTSWQKFYSLIPNLAILTKKSLTVSKVYRRILTPFQTHLWTILEGDICKHARRNIMQDSWVHCIFGVFKHSNNWSRK